MFRVILKMILKEYCKMVRAELIWFRITPSEHSNVTVGHAEEQGFRQADQLSAFEQGHLEARKKRGGGALISSTFYSNDIIFN
jgi:hypothetical protein